MIARGTTARGDHWTEIVLDDGTSVFAFCDAGGKPHEDSGGPIHVMGSDQVYDVLGDVVKQRNELRRGLREALELLQINGRRDKADEARVAELRKLVGDE